MITDRPRVYAVDCQKGGGSGFADISIENERGEQTTIAERVPWSIVHPLRHALEGLVEMAVVSQHRPIDELVKSKLEGDHA